MAERIQGAIDRIKDTVNHGKLKLKRRKAKDNVLKDSKAKIPDFERDQICARAREKAHSKVADIKTDLSKKVRDDFNI